MDIALWTPQGFNREFGKRQTNQLISCNTNDPLKPHKMDKFWNGFESIKGFLLFLITFIIYIYAAL